MTFSLLFFHVRLADRSDECMNLPANVDPAVDVSLSAKPWRRRVASGLFMILAAVPLFAVGGEQAVPPLLEAQKLDGSRYSLNDSRGVPSVLVVWSPESLASRKSLGELQRFTALHQQREVNVIAISTSGDAERLRHFANERQLLLPLAIMENTNLGPFSEQSLPRIYVFDRNGKLNGAHHGLFRLRKIEEMIAPLL
jgi:peroxiredoxin